MPSPQLDPASHTLHSLSPQASVHRSSRWMPLLGAGLGFVSLIAAVAGCSRPAATTEAAKPVYSDQQVADAKKAVCDAYKTGVKSINAAVSKRPDGPPDTVLPGTVLNARIAEVAVANFFFTTLDANPAAPADLQQHLRNLGEVYQNIVLTQLDDGTKDDVAPIAARADEILPKINQICQ